MKSGRTLLACLIAAMIGWAVTSASGQVPGRDQLKFEPLSGPNDNPVIWRVWMNDYTYERFIRTGLAHDKLPGRPQTRPGTWLALNGQYYPMQYIARRGAFHELRLVQWVTNPVPPPTTNPQQMGCCSWLWPDGRTRTCGPATFADCSKRSSGNFMANGDCLTTNPARTCVPRR